MGDDHPPSELLWYAVVFSRRFWHAGAHYLQAHDHRVENGRHVFYRDDRQTWAAPEDHVAAIHTFQTRPDAVEFFKRNADRLVRNPVPPRAAKSKPLSPVIEGFTARVSRPNRVGPKLSSRLRGNEKLDSD